MNHPDQAFELALLHYRELIQAGQHEQAIALRPVPYRYFDALRHPWQNLRTTLEQLRQRPLHPRH